LVFYEPLCYIELPLCHPELVSGSLLNTHLTTYMFAKPINLILVFIITIFNIVVLLLPFLVVIVPFVSFEDSALIVTGGVYQKLQLVVFITAFLVSFFMLLYLALDFLFGFSVRSSLKHCTRYEKLKDYDFLGSVFDQVRKKFNEKSVNLYVKNSDEINAYAVSSVGTKAIVLTRGLINHFLVECDDSKKFLYALRSIMGHEMSHLMNKDFLPTFLIIANQKATNFTSFFLSVIFRIIARVLSFMPYGGRISAYLITDAYAILNYLVTFFNRYIVYNLYQLLRRFISRSIEYRCDMQSAQAFGGNNMAFGLSMLGESGYFTLFSTHPNTQSRIRRVKSVKAKDSKISPRFFDSISNYFSLMFLVVICLVFAKQASIDVMVRGYLKNHDALNQKLLTLWHLFSKFL
jgi:Zn-dependent protease with chaperone function